ncbi:protein WVD2-like 7 isoform X2 [Diospyros lotus]|uniref:protein WVD2-like 7 isoform X2 n=1 Tax=Diospyros lotus TaxID=55363 RepID=UPI002254434A|nr:protein WVD2-like 7 isoform X2 [Diospyros lotus]XP_052173792.1 protein WVD2-like 7 isoform X2 [Diospyros lotus]XP_052173793.1 protein WVD2-like 7 isoform X2 [Diospyros lotus]
MIIQPGGWDLTELMGESMVEALNVENKMNASCPTLEVSVSFGRFENDSLSWEKWSTFSPNKYLEEVEKCSTPGSVAQKAAYFEAHYRKMAARKAEQLEQEMQMETNHLMKDDLTGEDHAGSTSEKLSTGHVQNSTGEVEKVTNIATAVSSSHSDEFSDKAAEVVECLMSADGEGKEEIYGLPEGCEINKSEEAVSETETHLNVCDEKVELARRLIHDDAPTNGFQDKVEPPISLEKETGNLLGNKTGKVKLDPLNKSQKMIPSRRENSLAGIKKKPASSLPKISPEISTPKTSKKMPASTLMSASRPSTKKASSPLLPRKTNPSTRESRKPAPSSLHMSLNLSSPNLDSTSFATRKSLIMEKMGDKDIVKRAFKTFQNNFSQVRASGGEKSSGKNEVQTMRPEQKLPTSLTFQKQNDGISKATEKMDSKRAQLGKSWNPTSARSLKGADMDQKHSKPALSFVFRSDDRAEKCKEILKNAEEKPYAKGTDQARHSSKEENKAEIKKRSQNIKSKATPMPGVSQGHLVSKGPADKEEAKNNRHRQSEFSR